MLPVTAHTLVIFPNNLTAAEFIPDHAHVKRVTPLQTRREEIMNDLQYQADAIDKGREKRTTALRRNKDTRHYKTFQFD